MFNTYIYIYIYIYILLFLFQNIIVIYNCFFVLGLIYMLECVVLAIKDISYFTFFLVLLSMNG